MLHICFMHSQWTVRKCRAAQRRRTASVWDSMLLSTCSDTPSHQLRKTKVDVSSWKHNDSTIPFTFPDRHILLGSRERINCHLLVFVPLMYFLISARETVRDWPDYCIHGGHRSMLWKVRHILCTKESTQLLPDGTLHNMFSLTIQNYHRTELKYGQVCFQWFHTALPRRSLVRWMSGKDYSNPRVLDFHTLHKPEEDMYDRSKVPRMPWYGLMEIGVDWVS